MCHHRLECTLYGMAPELLPYSAAGTTELMDRLRMDQRTIFSRLWTRLPAHMKDVCFDVTTLAGLRRPLTVWLTPCGTTPTSFLLPKQTLTLAE